MARIDRARLDAAEFKFVTEVPPRYTDLDPQKHVNNAALAAILQESRLRFQTAARVPQLLEGRRILVAAVSIEYAGETLFPDPIEIGVGILTLGRTSVTLGHRGRQGGRATFYAETVLVCMGKDEPTPIPAGMREVYEGLLIP
jgi:acyl-CoA thioester hydrolase